MQLLRMKNIEPINFGVRYLDGSARHGLICIDESLAMICAHRDCVTFTIVHIDETLTWHHISHRTRRTSSLVEIRQWAFPRHFSGMNYASTIRTRLM